MNARCIYIHALVILAIISAGISPACAFVSGKGLIEICAPDGTLQTIEVDAAFDPFAQIDKEQMPLSEHLESMEQCSYCFAMDHQKAHALNELSIPMMALPRYLAVSAGTAIPLGSLLTLYQPRGPPSFS